MKFTWQCLICKTDWIIFSQMTNNYNNFVQFSYMKVIFKESKNIFRKVLRKHALIGLKIVFL